MQNSSVTLVLGGAASGKSAWAERLARKSGQALVYIASATAFDDEMREKIARHQSSRAADGWKTIEAPIKVADAVASLEKNEIALFDCATLWLNNVLYSGADAKQATDALCRALTRAVAPVIVVSNELGHGVVPMDAETRAFRDAHGQMNQRIADCADLVVLVTAGLPQVLKGALP